MKCIREDCDNEATQSWQGHFGFFGGRKPGIHPVNWHLCDDCFEEHEKSEEGVMCDRKKLLLNNPHLKGVM